MHVTELIDNAIRERRTLFTFELLPPRKGEGTQKIFDAIDPLMEFGPSYINVTHHREEEKLVARADGTTERRMVRRRPGTVGISGAIMKRYGVLAVPHIICGGLSKYDIEDALIDMDFLGMNNVLALRGDKRKGEESFAPHPNGHHRAAGLVRQIADMNRGVFIDGEVEQCLHSRFCVGVAGYPEKHAAAPDIDSDIRALKEKVDAGAGYVVTQMSFDNGKILSFIDKCRKAGITVPIIPGLKPLSTISQLSALPEIFGVELPADLLREAAKCKDNADVRELGIEWAIAQGRELKAAGAPALHFYTMGRSDNMCRIARELF